MISPTNPREEEKDKRENEALKLHFFITRLRIEEVDRIIVDCNLSSPEPKTNQKFSRIWVMLLYKN